MNGRLGAMVFGRLYDCVFLDGPDESFDGKWHYILFFQQPNGNTYLHEIVSASKTKADLELQAIKEEHEGRLLAD